MGPNLINKSPHKKQRLGTEQRQCEEDTERGQRKR